jgi:hypothetical protein
LKRLINKVIDFASIHFLFWASDDLKVFPMLTIAVRLLFTYPLFIRTFIEFMYEGVASARVQQFANLSQSSPILPPIPSQRAWSSSACRPMMALVLRHLHDTALRGVVRSTARQGRRPSFLTKDQQLIWKWRDGIIFMVILDCIHTVLTSSEWQ